MSRQDDTRVILLGCGAVVRQFYVPALQELEKLRSAKLVAFFDPLEEAREFVASRFGTAEPFSSVEDVLKVKADLVIIASPPGFHRAQAEAAFDQSLHVLCEKPMAGSSGDCETMINAALKSSRVLAVGHYKRFFPSHQLIANLIHQQTFGVLEAIEIQEGGKFLWPATESFFRKEQTPGGVLLDLGVHVFDLLLWWLGEPEHFTYQDDAGEGVEANACLIASYSRGPSVSVRLSRDWRTLNTYAFRFENALVHLRVNQANRVEVSLNGIPMTIAGELRERMRTEYPIESRALSTNPQAFVAQCLDVIDSIRNCRPPLVSGHDGWKAVKWIEACYERRTPLPMLWMERTQVR